MSTDQAADPTAEDAPGGRRKLLVMLATLAAVAAAFWFYLSPAQGETEPVPGEVLQLEPIQLNLAAGRYLRIGIALQGVEGSEAELDGSQALDATIDLFSGRRMEDLAQRAQRELLKEKLRHRLVERYEGEVIDVYFTDFVTQ